TRDQLEEIEKMLAASTEKEQSKFWESLIDYMSTENWMDQAANEYVCGMTPEEMCKELEEVFKVGGEKFREEIALSMQAVFTSVIISFYNSLSMMAYGAPMSEWVGRAEKGDIEAY